MKKTIITFEQAKQKVAERRKYAKWYDIPLSERIDATTEAAELLANEAVKADRSYLVTHQKELTHSLSEGQPAMRVIDILSLPLPFSEKT